MNKILTTISVAVVFFLSLVNANAILILKLIGLEIQLV